MNTVVHWRHFFGLVQIVEIDVAILATRRKAHIIRVPINAHDLALMAGEAHAIRVRTCVEIEHVDVLILDYTGEEMASVGELYLVAALVHVRFEAQYLIAQHIAQHDLVLQSDDQVETARVESHRQALLWECLRDFVRLRHVVPYADGLVPGARNNELLSDAHIQPSDLTLVERSEHVVKLDFVVAEVIALEHNRRANELPV